MRREHCLYTHAREHFDRLCDAEQMRQDAIEEEDWEGSASFKRPQSMQDIQIAALQLYCDELRTAGTPVPQFVLDWIDTHHSHELDV